MAQVVLCLKLSYSMSQNSPDFASIQVLVTQASDAWFNGVIIESLTHGHTPITNLTCPYTYYDLGMYMALIAVVLWRIVSSSTPYGHQIKVLTRISVFMHIMATMHMAVRWFYARWAFIMNGEMEEMRFFALIDLLIAGGPLWIPTISSIVTGINILLADCVIELEDHCVSALVHTMWNDMTLSTTTVCTMLIVFRLSRANVTGKSIRFAPNPYHKVMEIVVESAAIYVVALAVYIPFLTTNSPYSNYPLVVLASLTIFVRHVTRPSKLEMGGSATSLEDDAMFITATKSVEVV
ncbi:hypothetical protein ARMGADRAFT_1038560 [Armillaria gallica]|uniref:Transmembrane protein n=1 Tax=Armillaria gallica TaxID=47427 RepID=A0A2H3CMD8_ARMGA|nr:hypothetical protein ARMGADRAFT_1038560 [Armillaria gallica]